MTLFFRPPLVGRTLGVGVANPVPPVFGHFSSGVGANGPCEVIIEADTDNAAGQEASNPKLIFVQDGGMREAAIFMSDNALNFANSIFGAGFRILTGTVNGFENAISRLFVNATGQVGIGDPPPDQTINLLEVAGKTKIDDDFEVTGDTILGGSVSFGRKASGAGNIDSTGARTLAVTDTTAVRTVTLTSADALVENMVKLIQDESGGASGNNILVVTEGSETINGAASDSITTDFGNIKIYSNGTNWFIESRK